MTRVQIKRRKSLAQVLKDMEIGTQLIIRNKEYKTTSVRNAITRLKEKAYLYECTEKGCIDYIKVRRIK